MAEPQVAPAAHVAPQAVIPGLAGVPVVESTICWLDGRAGDLQYRGYPIETLAEGASFEEVVHLLIEGRLPTAAELDRFEGALRKERAIDPALVEMLGRLPRGAHPMDVLGLGAVALAAFDPRLGEELPPEERRPAALRIVARLPTVLAAFLRLRAGEAPIAPDPRLGHAANFLAMIGRPIAHPLAERVFDACLVLHAEHQMNASTFAARVAASSLAGPANVVAAAIATLSGPLHGGANEAVLDALREIGAPERARAWAEARLAARAKVPGFGHREYKVKDPRARILQRLAVRLFATLGRTPLYDVAVALESAMEVLVGAKGIYPNVDFYSGIVYELLGIPVDAMTPVFAISRSAGWLAHWIEQIEANRIFRPSQVYAGERNRPFKSIEER